MTEALRDPDWIAWAIRLWPDSVYLQAEWMRAVATVRATSKGWLLDPARPVPPQVLAAVIRLERRS